MKEEVRQLPAGGVRPRSGEERHEVSVEAVLEPRVVDQARWPRKRSGSPDVEPSSLAVFARGRSKIVSAVFASSQFFTGEFTTSPRRSGSGPGTRGW